MILINKKINLNNGEEKMKKLSKVFGILMAMAIVLLSVLPVNAAAPSETYDIVVHKVLLKSLEGFPKEGGTPGIDGKTNYDGAKISNLEGYFGNGAKTVKGVYFEVVDKSTNKVVKEGATGDNGEVAFNGLAAGTYIVRENKSKTVLSGELNGKMPGSTIPITIVLPVYKAAGGKFTTGENALHVYPKNTVDEPTIEKSVTESKNMHDTVGIGQTKPFIIESVMPDKIEDYKVLRYTDQFSKGLSYQGELKVFKNDVEVTKDNNYEVTEPGLGTKNAKITVNFKESYIKTLRKGDKIKITYNATVNEDAVMGAANPNEIKLEYSTNPDSIKEKKPENPELHTGGKKFIKKDNDLNKPLDNAEFVIKNSKEKTAKYLKQDPTTLKIEWVDSKDTATKFVSKSGGLFEVKGLPYGAKGNNNTQGESTYYLEEIKAPTGYSLNTEAIEFKVNATSYYKDPTNISLGIADPQVINNHKVTIPQTGGIGSVVVIVGGILITALGIYMKKRNSRV